jgi:hypothetical protein
MKPLLSAVVPISGSETKYSHLLNWLPKFESTLLEVILVGDSLSMLQQTAIQQVIRNGAKNQIQFINDSFGDPGTSRNAGMAEVQGKWICFWDCDDIPEIPNFIEMCKTADEHGFNMSIGRFTSTDLLGDTKMSNRINTKWVSEEVVSNPGIWRTGFKHNLAEGLQFATHRMGEDQNFIQQVEKRNPNKYFYDDFVYHYFRNRPDSLTSNQNSIDDIRFVLKLSNSLLQEAPQSRMLQQALVKQSITCLKRASSKHRTTGLKLVVQFVKDHPWQSLVRLLPNIIRLLVFRFVTGR